MHGGDGERSGNWTEILSVGLFWWKCKGREESRGTDVGEREVVCRLEGVCSA